jgi:hypothetical protein
MTAKDITLEFSPPVVAKPEPAMVAGQVPGVPEITKTPPPAPTSLLPAIISLAKDSSVDVAKLDALLKMQADMEERQARQEAISAFTALSAEMPRVKKNGTIDMGTKGSIAFAKWDDIDKVIRPLLVKHGFTLSFNSTARDGGGLIVTGELMHNSGHVRTATIPLGLDAGPGRNNLQAMGSTLSYGKRYCAEMLLNIVREGDDDDGNKGGMAFITAEEADELRLLMEETKTEEARFCAIFNIAHLGEMQEANLTAAKNMLLAKKTKKPASVS